MESLRVRSPNGEAVNWVFPIGSHRRSFAIVARVCVSLAIRSTRRSFAYGVARRARVPMSRRDAMIRTQWIRNGALVATTAVGGLLAGCASEPIGEPELSATSTEQLVSGDQVG